MIDASRQQESVETGRRQQQQRKRRTLTNSCTSSNSIRTRAITKRKSASSSSSSSTLLILVQFLLSVWSFAVLIRLASSSSPSIPSASVDNESQQHQQGDGSSNSNAITHPIDYLNENSVILLTGAAGFIGSELALALYRTYQPSKIICIDSMDGITPTISTTKNNKKNTNNEQDLALLEYKRQRVFNIMQTLGPVANFYRTDFRPNVPQFAEAGEVPILHYIFTAHPDITHVVHMADAVSGAQDDTTQVIPHLAGETKAGMMESLLEELAKMKQEQGRAPHFLYASTHEIYHHSNNINNEKKINSVNPPPFQEHLPLTTPSSFRGAAKLMDELLAQSYYERDNIYSVGLRFFQVYGPWGVPSSSAYEMSEQIIQQLMTNATITTTTTTPQDNNKNVYDYVYIDDAVDAIMTAMQFRPDEDNDIDGNEEENDDDLTDGVTPIIINVGSGQGTTLHKIANTLQSLVMNNNNAGSVEEENAMTVASADEIAKAETVSIASTDRAEALLGFKARVSLRDGLERQLAWHYDRAFPYGGPLLPTAAKEGDSGESAKTTIADKGMVSCSPYDAECLRGAPVFPCASECSRPGACTTSVYDDVLAFTRQLTHNCEAVMYTVALDEELQSLPTAKIDTTNSNIKSFLSGTCNLAFVSDASVLVRKRVQDSNNNKNNHLSHGPWTLVPLSMTSSTESTEFLQLIPKLSPGLFFSDTTQYGIYADPNVMFADIGTLLEEVRSKSPPGEEDDGKDGRTALMVGNADAGGDGKKQQSFHVNDYFKAPQAIVQEAAYRMIRIAVIDDLGNDDFSHSLDTSFLVHLLNHKDSSNDVRLFRCDVMEQIVQWDVTSDESALQFILGLHDLWNNVVTRHHGKYKIKETTKNQENEAAKDKESVATVSRRRLEEVHEEGGTDDSEDDEDGASGSFITGWGQEHNGFGMPESIQDAVRAVFGDASIMKQEDAEDDDVEEEDDDENNNDEDLQDKASSSGKDKEEFIGRRQQQQQQDSSVWMGILSSSNVRHYARIIPSRQVGVIHLDEEGRVLVQ